MMAPELAQLLLPVLLLGLIIFGIYADGSRWGGWLTGPVWIVILAAFLSNLGVMPHRSPLYDGVSGELVPAAVGLFLLKADLRRIIRETGRTLVAFMAGAVVTVIGVFGAMLIFNLGPDESRLAGIVTANLIGGTVNVIAVANAVGFTDPTRYAALLTGGAAALLLYFVVVGAIAASPAISRHFKAPQSPNDAVSGGRNVAATPITATDILLPLLIAAALVTGGRMVAAAIGKPELTIIIVTVLAILLANLWPAAMLRVRLDTVFGTIFMFAFFATLGASVELAQLLGPAAIIAGFTLAAALFHLFCLLLLSRVMGISIAEALVASVAGIMGPTTAAGFAGGRGWTALVSPAVLVGVLGIAIANFAGLAVSSVSGP